MEEEINLIDYWRVVLRSKKILIIVIVLITSLSIVYSLLQPKIYKAEATLIPVGGGGSGGISMVAAQLGLGAFLGGAGGGTGASGQLLAIMKSRTLAERMIEKYDLQKVLYPAMWDNEKQSWRGDKAPPMEETVEAFQSIVTFTDDRRAGLMRIKAEWTEPVMTAEIVNEFILVLSDYLNENALTTAKRNRLFIEGQLERNKAELLESGKAISSFYATNRVSNVVSNLDVSLSISDPLPDPKTTPTVPLLSVHQGTAASDPPSVAEIVAELQKKTEALQEKANELGGNIHGPGVVKNVPQQIYLQYLILQRELLGQVNALLTQQYQFAKINESKEDLNFQVIDFARVPIKKYKPNRRKIVMMGFSLSCVLAVFCAFLWDFRHRKREPSYAASSSSR